MNHYTCPHIEGSPEAQRRRAEDGRRRLEETRAKVRAGRWDQITPEERGLIDAALHAVGPEA